MKVSPELSSAPRPAAISSLFSQTTPGGLLRAALGLASAGLLTAAAWSVHPGAAFGRARSGLGSGSPLTPLPVAPVSHGQRLLQGGAPGPRARRLLQELSTAPEPAADTAVSERRLSENDGTAVAPPRRAFILYSTWHAPSWRHAQALAAAGQPLHTVDDVLESRGRLSFANITLSSVGHWAYHTMPQRGPYSIYTPRQPGELHYNEAFDHKSGDPHYRSVLRRHARQLSPFDGVVVDATNLAGYDEQSDEIQLRPFENLLSVWAELRRHGRATPNVAVWLRLPRPGSDGAQALYPKFLAVMNQPAYRNMFVRDVTGKKFVVFYSALAPSAHRFVEDLERNGNRHNIAAVPMGAHLDPSQPATPDTLSFMSACQFGTAVSDEPCGQVVTQHPHLGTMMSAATSYQQSLAALPGGATGTRGGTIAAAQFAAVLQQQPDNLFVSSFNEHQAQFVPISSDVGTTTAPMGFELDPAAFNKASVDTYGHAFSRDIEPHRRGGSDMLTRVSAFVELYKDGKAACTDRRSACWSPLRPTQRFATVNPGTDRAFGLAAPAHRAGRTQAPLYQCDATGDDFSRRADCDGRALGAFVGSLSKHKNGQTPRTLLRCQDGDGTSISLTGTCPPKTRLQTLLGYVS